MYMHVNIFKIQYILYVYVFIYTYIHNKQTVHIHILCKQKLLFWM